MEITQIILFRSLSFLLDIVRHLIAHQRLFVAYCNSCIQASQSFWVAKLHFNITEMTAKPKRV